MDPQVARAVVATVAEAVICSNKFGKSVVDFSKQYPNGFRYLSQTERKINILGLSVCFPCADVQRRTSSNTTVFKARNDSVKHVSFLTARIISKSTTTPLVGEAMYAVLPGESLKMLQLDPKRLVFVNES